MTKNFYTVDLTCNKIDHVIHQTVEAEDFTEAIRLAVKEWEVLSPVVQAVRLGENPATSHDDKRIPVVLTGNQWQKLSTYLLMSAKYREGERDAWRELSIRKLEDGTPEYKNATSNADFWEEMIADLSVILEAIENA